MMTKYQMISALAEDTAREVTRNEQEWKRYLTTAARLYKYPFNEQLLIFAQRPDATACASLELWNEKMFCWVNRGAKGIALPDLDSERPRLKYVFDVSDVHKAKRIGREPYLWELREEHKESVIKQLEKTYGETDENRSFEERLLEIAQRIAYDYYEEILPELDYVKEGSFLEELDEQNTGIRLRETLASSISYTLLSRCGADMELWKEDMNFEYIHDFGSTKVLSVLGTATSEMCKPLLMEIGRTIGAYDRQKARNQANEMEVGEQISTHEKNMENGLAKEPQADYNALKRESETQSQVETDDRNKREVEGMAHETDIREERGLSDSEPDSKRGAGGGIEQVRSDEEELSEGTPEGDLSGNGTDRRTESTLSEDTGAGRAENGTSDRADGEVGGSERGTESSRSDELGSKDEQYQTFSRGDRTDGADLQLGADLQQNTEIEKPDNGVENSLSGSFFETQITEEQKAEIWKGILCSDTFLTHKRPEIAGYFQMEQNTILQMEYLQNCFPENTYFALNVADRDIGFRAGEDGLYVNMTGKAGAEHEEMLSWNDARYLLNSYIEDGVYLLPGEVAEQIDTDGMYQQLDLFAMFSEQVGSIAMKQAESGVLFTPEAKVPQEQLDEILRSGGGRTDSRKRIYAKYQQGKTPEEMAEFLKKEYGTTGKGFDFDGKQMAVWFDKEGMRLGYGTSATDNPVKTMSWQEIEVQIRTQVENGAYMSANEVYLVDAVEKGRIAEHLFFFFRDGMGEMPEELELKVGNYPDAHARLVELLGTPEGVSMIAGHMDHALHQLETGEKELRFRSIVPKEELRAELDNLLVEKKEFPTSEKVEVRKEDFITQDEIDHRLGRGSSFSYGAFRIYDYFKEGHDRKEAADFLKHEYGTGGSSHALAGADHSWEDHDAKPEIEETEFAFQLADRYISIQTVEGGYDYSIMGEDYKELDGGVYDNPNISIREALADIVQDLKESEANVSVRGSIKAEDELQPIDYDGLMEKVEAANRIEPQSSVVEEFRAKTNGLFHDISELNASEVEETVKCHVQAKIDEYGIDAVIVDAVVTGSRCRGLEQEGSDLDVVVELSTKEREDDLFNAFNEDGLHIGDVKVDINPITAQKTGTLETYLPQAEEYLAGVKAAREQDTLGHNVQKSEQEAEVTLTVAECSEFHNMGEFHDNIPTVEEAVTIWKQIPPERMNGIPAIGIHIHKPGEEAYQDTEMDILTGKHIDLEMLEYVPEIANSPKAIAMIGQMIEQLPDMEVRGSLEKWLPEEKEVDKIAELAAAIDQFAYDFDTYEYKDSVDDREAQIESIAEDIRNGNTDYLSEFLNAAISNEIKDGIADIFGQGTDIEESVAVQNAREAKELLDKLAEYKPLAKIEEQEEQNYNMVDNVLNNGAGEKAEKEERKKEQTVAKPSLKARLAQKQAQVSGQGKVCEEQENTKKNQREM